MSTRRRRFLVCILVAALTGGLWIGGAYAGQGAANPWVAAAGRMDEKWWAERHRQKLWTIKNGDAKLLFIGDSITHGWDRVGKDVWAKYYGTRHAVNLGFGGDRTQNVIWRLDNGEIDGVNPPAAAVVMIGTNNGADSAENVAEGITAIVHKLQAKCPDINVLLLAILPCGERPGGVREKNAKSSEIVSKLADGKHVFYLDIGSRFLNPDGTIRKALMPDAVHPNADGYAVEAEAIEPMVRTIMAEPAAATRVDFRADGICRVNGKPFFPIGCWVYGIDEKLLADLHEHRFNTVVGSGVIPAYMPLIEQNALMCIPMATDEMVKAAKGSPSLLAWYLTDEPEEHGETPAQVLEKYRALKAKDSDHPIGITHDTLHGPLKYVGACDFTMTDVYPVTRDRKWPLNAVGMYTDRPREIHGKGWPNFTFIQTFGGPDSDGGLWAQPRPDEVRCLAFDALAHRADGILYFSYWPRAADTWQSVAALNRDIEQLVPWLLAEGEEKPSKATGAFDDALIDVRAKRIAVAGGNKWMILAVNTKRRALDAKLSVEGLGDVELRMPFATKRVTSRGGAWDEHFEPCEAKAWLVGNEPAAVPRVTTK